MNEVVAYALDYGTSNTLLMPVYKDKEKNQDIGKIPVFELKSILFCNDHFQWSFGDKAITDYTMDPLSGRLFKSLKRFLPEPSFKGTQVYHKFYSLHDIISTQIKHMRDLANEHFQQDVTQVVMGHPALFSENEEQHQLAFERLGAAAKTAGFKNIEFCPEPIAAAYNYHQSLSEEKMILIVDLGGGTSDFTVCKLGPREFSSKDVLSIHGVSTAGDKFDSSIMKHKIAPYYGSNMKYRLPMSTNWLSFPKAFVNKLTRPADILMLSSSSSYRFIEEAKRYAQTEIDKGALDLLLTLVDDRLGFALFREIENSKIQLSSSEKVTINFEELGKHHFTETLTNSEFVEHSQSCVDEIFNCLDETLMKAELKADQIDHVFVTGGTSQIPKVQSELNKRFPGKIKAGTVFQSIVEGLAEFGTTTFL